MAAVTLGTLPILDGAGATVTTQQYTDPNHSNAKGPVVAVLLGDGALLTPGQALEASSVPVVLTAAQITTLTPPAALTGFATSSKQDTEISSLASLDTKTPALGQALAAASTPVVLTAAQLTTLTPLAGAATAAKQPALGTAGTASADVLSVQGVASMTPLLVNGSAVTQPISGTVTANAGTNLNTSALALEAGGNLDTLVTNTGKIPALGQALAGASVPVVLTAAQITTLTPPVAITGFSTTAKQDTGNNFLASLDSKAPALGQALAGASVPVVLTASQLTTLTPPAALTGFATSTLQGTGNTSIASIDTKTPALGQALAGASVPVVLTAAQITSLTAPVLAAGTAIVGKVTTDQTTHGTTDLVAADITKVAGAAISQGHGTAATAIRVELPTDGTGVVGLIAGAAIVGKVGIDQTTVGTTNAVSLAQLGTTTIATGNGVVSAGVQRVSIASDNTPFSIKLDQTTPGTTESVTVKSSAYVAQTTVTRPANTTAYTAGDVVGGAITFSTIGSSGGHVVIDGADLRIDVAAIPSGMTTFRLYLYDVTPPSALADNAAWDLPSGDRASFLGYIDLGTVLDLGSTLFVENDTVQKKIKLNGSANVFCYLVTAGAFTPAGNSEVYTPRLQSIGV